MALEKNIEDLEVRLLLEAIYVRYGYDLREYAPASMRRRVMAALSNSGLSSLGELQHQLLKSPELFSRVLEDLTVRVSEMFRDPTFYSVFRSRVVPILRTYPMLKIWHTGCAAGEEVYSNAIMLAEEGLQDRVQIYATDVSAPAVEQAKQGFFRSEHVPNFRENYEKAGGTAQLSDYYTEAYGQIAMQAALRRNVLFFQHNLVSDHVFGEMHVIFCRNVLIYFSRELRDRVLAKLTQSLCPGGFLCLGSSERLPLAQGDQHFEEFSAEERIYRYEGRG